MVLVLPYTKTARVRQRMLDHCVRDPREPQRATDEDVIWAKQHANDLFEDYIRQIVERGIWKQGETILRGGNDTLLLNMAPEAHASKVRTDLPSVSKQSQSADQGPVIIDLVESSDESSEASEEASEDESGEEPQEESEEEFEWVRNSSSKRMCKRQRLEPIRKSKISRAPRSSNSNSKLDIDVRPAKRRRVSQNKSKATNSSIGGPNLELVKKAKFSIPDSVLFKDAIPEYEVVIGYVRKDPAPQRIVTAWYDRTGKMRYHIRNTHIDFIARPPHIDYESISVSKKWTLVNKISDFREVEIDNEIDGDKLDGTCSFDMIAQFVSRHAKDDEV